MVFTVARNGTTAEATEFTLAVTEAGGPMATSGLSASPLELTIDAGQSSAAHTVSTAADADWEQHAEITAVATSDFSFENNTSSLTKQVSDDDFPAAEAVLRVSPLSVAERTDAVVTVTLSVTTDDDHQPHAGTGTIAVATTPGTATAADYRAISAVAGAVSFDVDDFSQVDIGGGVMRWRASTQIAVGIVDDAAKEPQEQFSVSMALVTTGSDPTDAGIALGTDTEFSVSIDPSDLSNDASLSSLGIAEATFVRRSHRELWRTTRRCRSRTAGSRSIREPLTPMRYQSRCSTAAATSTPTRPS